LIRAPHRRRRDSSAPGRHHTSNEGDVLIGAAREPIERATPRPRPHQEATFSRASRYLDRAGPRQSCGRDHAGALRVITRAEVAKEDNALTHHCDDQGYDYGDNRAVSLHIAMLPDCWLR